MRLVATLLALALSARAAPPRRAAPDEAAIKEAMGKPSAQGDRYVSGRALEHYLRSRIALQDGDLEGVLSELRLAVLYDPTNPFPRYALAKEYERRGRLDDAEGQVKEALGLERSHVPSLILGARLAFARGKPERALEPLRRAVQADPQSVEAFALLVRAQVLRKDIAGALAVLDRLDGLALAATDRAANVGGKVQRLAAEALTEVAGALAATGRVARAEELLRRAIEREPGDPGRIERLVGFLEEHGRHRDAAEAAARGVYVRAPSPAFAARAARLFLLAGDASRARAFVDTLVQFVVEEVRGAEDEAMQLGAALLRTRAWEDAARLFEAAGKQDPSRAEAHLAAGAAWEWLGQTANARAAYERVPDDHPMARQARARGLACAARLGDAAAIAALGKLVAENPEETDSALVLASVLETRGEFRRALEALALAKPTIPVRRAQSRLERRAGNPAASLMILDELARRSPPDAELDYDRALALLALERRPEALASLRKALASEPGHVDAANVLAWLLVETSGSLQEAEALAARALAARPDDPHLLDTFGWVLLARGQVQAAVEALRRAAQGAPEDAEIAEHLAAAVARAGRVDEARELYGRVIRLAEANKAEALAARAAKALDALGRSEPVSP